eukprot:3350156-Amphidinium_carterae.1
MSAHKLLLVTASVFKLAPRFPLFTDCVAIQLAFQEPFNKAANKPCNLESQQCWAPQALDKSQAMKFTAILTRTCLLQTTSPTKNTETQLACAAEVTPSSLRLRSPRSDDGTE